jgi:hypothetical protein
MAQTISGAGMGCFPARLGQELEVGVQGGVVVRLSAGLATVGRHGYNPPMTDAPDLEQLARRYLDLWQEQAAAVIGDPATAQAMGRAYALWGRGLAGFGEGQAAASGSADASSPPPTTAEGAPNSSDDDHAPISPAAGTQAPGPASCGTGVDYAVLADRLARLEERIGRLEAAFAAGLGPSQKPGRKRRS